MFHLEEEGRKGGKEERRKGGRDRAGVPGREEGTGLAYQEGRKEGREEELRRRSLSSFPPSSLPP